MAFSVSNQQHPEEWEWFMNQVMPIRSVLEIGSYAGHSLKAFAERMGPGALIRSIDGGKPQDGSNMEDSLIQTVKELAANGYDAQACIGDSHVPKVVDWAAQWQPYDLVFIDGDHTLAGVLLDWQYYGPMGKVVAFHDIGHEKEDKMWDVVEPGVNFFWQELRKGTYINGKHTIMQFAAGPQGVGVVRWQ